MAYPPLTIDFDFTHAVQQYQPQWLTVMMRLISDVIDPATLCVFGVLAAAYLFWRKHDRRTIVMIVAITAGNFLTLILKPLIARPRPDADVVNVLVREPGYGFPSGHAVAVVLLGGTIALLVQRLALHHQRLWVALVALIILLVGYSRIYLGVHWLSDVVAGYVVGLSWLVVVALGRKWYLRRRSLQGK